MPNGDTPESARTNDNDANSGAKLQKAGDNASDIAKDSAASAKVEPYFDKLFKTIQEKTDENDNVVLFQRVEGSSIGKEASEREAASFVLTAGRCGNYICGCAQFLLTL